MFPCTRCGQRVFLFRGLCADCAPDLHAARDLVIQETKSAFDTYEAETGKRALADWLSWESWADRNEPTLSRILAAEEKLEEQRRLHG